MSNETQKICYSFDEPDVLSELLLMILCLLLPSQEVHPNSPAAQAGLIPHSDYILGSDAMMSTDDDFYTLIENNNHKQLRLYVYNSEMDSCREVRWSCESHVI